MLAQIFPAAQFIFMYRNPITTVNSAVHYVPKNVDPGSSSAPAGGQRPLHAYRVTSKHWTRVMEIWRHVRHLLEGRYIEIPQEHIVQTPSQVAERLCTFLGIPQLTKEMADVFSTRRENTAFPDKAVDDFFYPVDWTDEQKAVLAEESQREVAYWGYELDFDYPGAPDPARATRFISDVVDMETYYWWLSEQDELEKSRQLAMCREQLARIEQGRIMRALNAGERLFRRLGLRG
jgi:hypothetical protein